MELDRSDWIAKVWLVIKNKFLLCPDIDCCFAPAVYHYTDRTFFTGLSLQVGEYNHCYYYLMRMDVYRKRDIEFRHLISFLLQVNKMDFNYQLERSGRQWQRQSVAYIC